MHHTIIYVYIYNKNVRCLLDWRIILYGNGVVFFFKDSEKRFTIQTSGSTYRKILSIGQCNLRRHISKLPIIYIEIKKYTFLYDFDSLITTIRCSVFSRKKYNFVSGLLTRNRYIILIYVSISRTKRRKHSVAGE